MKRLFLLVAMVLFALQGLYAQTQYEYTYDDNGNRIVRQVISLIRSAQTPDEKVSDQQTIVLSEENVNIYPNPVTDVLKVEIDAELEEEFDYVVLDLQGKEVVKGKITSNRIEIDLAMLAPGSYILHVYSQTTKTQWKVIKD